MVDTDQENEQQLVETPELLADYPHLPKQVITYSLRSKDIVLSDQLAQEKQFQKDSYVKSKQSKSVLVVPVKRKEEIIALLYLENNLNTGVFHKKRVELVKALATQLAISMENTLLYENLEGKVEMRTRELQESNDELQVMNEELRQTQEELQTQRDYVAEKNKVLEEFNTKISGSLKVAQTIQEAMLPYQTKLDELLRNYFVINRPKDVVSGDFYWLNKIDGKIILVVADCTGHGIPGAFMTLIGSNLLDKIIRLRKITQPADILTRLHEEIKSVLKQRYTSNNQGMDAVVVTLEPQGGQTLMTFAGAKNNIYYYHNKTLNELKGTRKSIGGFQDEITQFTSEQVRLPLGSTLYLGSDGLEDQNNPERKKFGRKRLKNLLSNLSNSPLIIQKVSIEKALDDYMQGSEQRDDILWMGVSI